MNGHQVQAGDRLGDGVLHLQTRIGLHEHETIIGAGVHQELDRAHAAIGRGGGDSRGGVEHLFSHGRRKAERGRDLHELLALPLQAALAVPEMDDGTGTVPDDLHLDMARAREQLLDVECCRAKGLLGFGTRPGKRLSKVASFEDGAHAASPAAADRLQHHRAVRP